ncbi:MAG: GNAT family N-acetyltransferase [Varibaculum sp.]|nr:GNAT family N-acetyltransferase [Varibaculum sp.]
MAVELITEYSPEVEQMMTDLIPQLSSSAQALTEQQVRNLIAQPNVYLFGYRDETDGKLKGMLSLATFEIPTGVRAWIEDVVVDGNTRGKGAGQELVETAVTHAKNIGARTVDLTSRPAREAANRLYRRCGFELRETNVYRFSH